MLQQGDPEVNYMLSYEPDSSTCSEPLPMLLYSSQNHRMVEVRRNLWISSGQTPCSSRAI